MLNVNGSNKFYYIRNFHDMRCKSERVLSIIHQQLNREPSEGEVFIMMSRNQKLVRLFSYDSISCSFYEKRFYPGYTFMKVVRTGSEPVYSIDWRDVVLLLENPVVKSLDIK